MTRGPDTALHDEIAQLTAQLAQARLAYFESDTKLSALVEADAYITTTWMLALEARSPRLGKLLLKAMKLVAWSLSGDLMRYLRAARRRDKVTNAPITTPYVDNGESISGAPLPPAPGAGTILVADSGVCQPDRHAGARTTFNTLSALREGGWSVVFWAQDRLPGGRYNDALEAMGVVVLDSRWRGSFRDWLDQYGTMLDQALLMRPVLTEKLLPDLLRRVSCRLIYQGHDLHFARLGLAAKHFNDPLLEHDSARHLALERRIWRTVDMVLYVSKEEAEEVARLEPTVKVGFQIPYCFASFPQRAQPPAGHDLLFVGGCAHAPNEDAVLWFAKEILPLVHAQVPQARLLLVGPNPTAAVSALAGPNVDVLGAIDDAALTAAYANSRVSIAPLRYGAGVKGKVVEAMAFGLPVVTTEIGAQGLPGLAEIMPICDDAAAYADAVVRLLQDDEGWVRQSAAQLAYAEQNFSKAALRRSLFDVLGASAESVITG